MTPAEAADQQRLTSHVAEKIRDSNYRIVITGAGGWLGLATLELLDNTLSDFDERVRCFGATSRTLSLRTGRAVPQLPLAEIRTLDRRPTILLHLAFLTKDRVADMSEADYRQDNRTLSETVLGALDAIGVVGIFVSSSGAAQHENDDTAGPALRLYGSLKRSDEDMFAEWAKKSNTTAVIARIFNLSGPYINKPQHYALASFILDALAGQPVVVKAPHMVIRGSVAIRELMSLIFALLVDDDHRVVRFDTAGEPLELADIAQRTVEAIGGGPVQRAPISAAKIDNYGGNPIAYNSLLAHHKIEPVDLTRQIRETATFLAGLATR